MMCTATIPKTLCIFWFHLKEISFEECFAHMFFIHNFTGMESGVLMLMALDRYVVICCPLRYSSILTNSVILRGKIIRQTYCDQLPVAMQTCGNLKANAVCGLVIALCPVDWGSDILCITASYTMILRAAGSLSSPDARQKAFSTCTAHICAIALSYSPAFFCFFFNRFGSSVIPPSCHIIVADIYLLLPPTINPIVYEVKTKQIRDCILRIFANCKDTESHRISKAHFPRKEKQ
ncbi:Olfactory receptor 52N4 [Heterocephalus glaber]|uniref:Olfactory receptor 52N4 n=1 Tax=Heterocephalus glaber TaxID=10181 RepID=G5ANS0_HETGA|nr:Olfactory receptor 52N4 [Heterocephalus glaber]